MRILKYIVFLIPSLLWGWTETFTTDSFIIEITWDCPEGSVTCDYVKFRIRETNKKEIREYIGSTMHSIGADGVTPSRLQGYNFEDEQGAKYFIGIRGYLEITYPQKQKYFHEEGEFDYIAQPVAGGDATR